MIWTDLRYSGLTIPIFIKCSNGAQSVNEVILLSIRRSGCCVQSNLFCDIIIQEGHTPTNNFDECMERDQLPNYFRKIHFSEGKKIFKKK